VHRREDDEAEAVRGRYLAYEANKEGLSFFKEDPESGLPPFIQVNVENKTVEEVFEEVRHQLAQIQPSALKKEGSQDGTPSYKASKEPKDGELVGAIERARVRQQIKILSGSNKKPTRFPGVHPINMGHSNANLLGEQEYLFARKIDGERRLLVLMEGSCYLVDRKMDAAVYPSIRVPRNCNLTLLDGELVSPDGSHEGNKEVHFVVLDALCVGGDSVLREYLPDRLDSTVSVLEAVEQETSVDKMPFTFKLQKYFKLTQLPSVVEQDERKNGSSQEVSENEKKDAEEEEESKNEKEEKWEREVDNVYSVDGFIFMPVTMPYRLGWCQEITKWKSASNDTIDFRLIKERPRENATTPTEGERWSLCVRAAMEDLWHADIEVSQEDIDRLQLQSGDIVECLWEREGGERARGGRWKVVRKRTDKEAPNADWVVRDIEENMKQPFEMPDLLANVAKYANSTGGRRRGGGGRGGHYRPPRGGGYNRGNNNYNNNRDRSGGWDRGRDGDRRSGGGASYHDRERDKDRQREGERSRDGDRRPYERERDREYRSAPRDRERDRDDGRTGGGSYHDRERDGDRRSGGGASYHDRERDREPPRSSGADSWRREPPSNNNRKSTPATKPADKTPPVNVWAIRQAAADAASGAATLAASSAPVATPEEQKKPAEMTTTTTTSTNTSRDGRPAERREPTRHDDAGGGGGWNSVSGGRRSRGSEPPAASSKKDDGWSTVETKRPRRDEPGRGGDPSRGQRGRNNNSSNTNNNNNKRW